jgi:AcrR family transcriptional regulator
MRVKTEKRRETILKVASEVFLELGLERASMAEISARVGGSKATLYNYFPSKEALFLAVTLMHGKPHVDQALSMLHVQKGDLALTLRRYGESILALLASPEVVGALRVVIAQSGNSDIGRDFYKAGPQVGHQAMEEFMLHEVKAGRLREVEANVLSAHLRALLEADLLIPLLLGVRQTITKVEIKRSVANAISAFMAAYAT